MFKLLQDRNTFIKAKKRVPDLLFLSGECDNGVLSSSSVSSAEYAWLDTDGTKERKYTAWLFY